MQNDPVLFAALAAGLVALLAIALFVVRQTRRRRTAALKRQFGPEYDLALERHGSRARAERDLAAREKRLDELHIVSLSEEQCDRFSAGWSEVQQRFVDDPSGAVRDADHLVKDVMSARGYPMGDFEQRAADLSVEHGSVVQHYRAARGLAQASQRGEASTEDLRKAMVYYRALFTDLLQTRAPAGRLSEAHA